MQRDKLAIAEQFKAVDPLAHYQKDYYGPYNSLLTMLFPFHEGFQISPRWILQGDNAEPFTCGTHFATFISFNFVVQIYGHTVFILQIVDNPIHDDQRMRAMFSECIDMCRLPKLYGVSARDAQYAIYELQVHNRILVPARVEKSDARRYITKARGEWWKYDVLQEQGFSKSQEITQEIKEMVKAHHDKLVATDSELGAPDEQQQDNEL